jgi:hypothetical protein
MVLITMASNFVAVAVFLALALVSVIATPLIVKRALAGVRNIAEERSESTSSDAASACPRTRCRARSRRWSAR